MSLIPVYVDDSILSWFECKVCGKKIEGADNICSHIKRKRVKEFVIEPDWDGIFWNDYPSEETKALWMESFKPYWNKYWVLCKGNPNLVEKNARKLVPASDIKPRRVKKKNTLYGRLKNYIRGLKYNKEFSEIEYEW